MNLLLHSAHTNFYHRKHLSHAVMQVFGDTASLVLLSLDDSLKSTLFLAFKLLKQALDGTAKLATFVMFILVGSTVFSFTFNAADGHIWVEHLFDKLPGGALGFLIVVNILVFILGCFIDFFEIAFIVIPMLIQSFTLPLYYHSLLGGDPRNVVILAGVLLIAAAVAALFVKVPDQAPDWRASPGAGH